MSFLKIKKVIFIKVRLINFKFIKITLKKIDHERIQNFMSFFISIFVYLLAFSAYAEVFPARHSRIQGRVNILD